MMEVFHRITPSGEIGSILARNLGSGKSWDRLNYS